VKRVLFARIGWMTYYRGPQAGDERPKGGGAYTRTKLGNEAFNFMLVGDELFGYLRPPQAKSIQLGRIDPGNVGDSLQGVTVIFVATRPAGGQCVVGWYKHATVFRRPKPDSTGKRMGFAYYVIAPSNGAVLLPTWKRTQVVKGGKGGFGQSNIRYVYDGAGQYVRLPWAESAAKYVRDYDGENLFEHPEQESVAAIEDAIETQLNRAAGFASNPKIRAAVESRAMHLVEQHYRRLGFVVTDVHKTQSYDFLCERHGRRLYVEVKGTRGLGESVALTAKEVDFAHTHTLHAELCVVHSISVTGTSKPKSSGGTLVKYEHWNPAEHELRPLAFVCRLHELAQQTAAAG
jgi:hypothetical protein